MAYNRYYQYDTNPRKLKPEYEPERKRYPKKSTARKTNKKEDIKQAKKIDNKTQKKIILYIAVCFASLLIISFRYSKIDDTYAELKNLKSDLAVLEKETAQLEANIESRVNLTKIEEEATNLLGMKKLTSDQIIYVTLPKEDHVETSSEEVKNTDLSQNWIVEIINKIIQKFK